MENEAEAPSECDMTERKVLAETNANKATDVQFDEAGEAREKVSWEGEDIGHANENDEEDRGEDQPILVDQSAPAKKKKKKKSKSKRGLGAPTGFEEYYVDTPITPEEHAEERSIYHPSLAFSERIETAIQRYKAKRNLDSERKNLFDKYMSYGGVDSGPKMFGGGFDAAAMEDKSAGEITALTATNVVGSDKDAASAQFVVDFDGCLKGFLSSRLPQCFELSTEKQIKSHMAVIRNFLNYLLHHDVCPEYNDQINAARATCNLAEKELFECSSAAALMPGDFNKACSAIFGGYYENLYVGDAEWAKGIDFDPGMSPEKARKILKTGLAAQGDDKIIDAFKRQTLEKQSRVINAFRTGLEITEIICADQEVLALYKNVPACKPLGKLKVKTWYRLGPQEDLTEEEEALQIPKPVREYDLWVEDELLQYCFVGMKFEATLRELSFGVYYFDTLASTHCSFYTVLPNELMIGWKEHVYLPPREKNVEGIEVKAYEGDEETNAEFEE